MTTSDANGGANLMQEPLIIRQQRLSYAIANSGLLVSANLPGSPAEIVKRVQALGLAIIPLRATTVCRIPVATPLTHAIALYGHSGRARIRSA
jgi:hypothetical protein